MPAPEPRAAQMQHSEIFPAHHSSPGQRSHPAAPATRSTHLRLDMPAATPISAIDTSLLICGSKDLQGLAGAPACERAEKKGRGWPPPCGIAL